MRKNFFFTCVCFFVLMGLIYAQPYTTTESEAIFSMADVLRNGRQMTIIPRLSLFFHFSGYVHFDMSSRFGLMTGIGVRNIGFITREDTMRIKRRAYTAGIPVALKLGNLKEEWFFLAGGECEIPMYYKEKWFYLNVKTKYNEWFGDKVSLLLPSVFIGLQLPDETVFRIRYYLNDFLHPRNYFNATGINYTRSRLFSFSVSKSMTAKKKKGDALKQKDYVDN